MWIVVEKSAEKIFFVPDLTHSHDMRHTYATILFDNDISVKAISKVMGHSKASTTYNVYIEKHLVAYDVIPFLQELINNLLPKPKIFDIVFLDTTINALI